MTSLYSLLRKTADHLSAHATLLSMRGQPAAAQCSEGLAAVIKAALNQKPTPGSIDRPAQVEAIAALVAPSNHSGLGDTVVCDGYRAAGMHSAVDAWESLTNQIREVQARVRELLMSRAGTPDDAEADDELALERPGM